jgi:hypothetical protein
MCGLWHNKISSDEPSTSGTGGIETVIKFNIDPDKERDWLMNEMLIFNIKTGYFFLYNE